MSLQAPIKQVKGVRDGDTFTEVPEEQIVKGYEYAKGSHVLIDPKEIDDLKLEAKHTIDMVRFVRRTRLIAAIGPLKLFLALPEHHDDFVEASPRCKVCGRIKSQPTVGLPRHFFCLAARKKPIALAGAA
jgi:Ku70/Ku80 beta-barrel domain